MFACRHAEENRRISWWNRQTRPPGRPERAQPSRTVVAVSLFAKAVFLAAVALLVTGCLDMDARVAIEPDGSGEFHLHLTVASEVLGIMSLNGDQSPAEVCADMWDESSDGDWGFSGAGELSATSWGLNRNGECSMAFTDEWGAAESARKMREYGIARTGDGGYRYESPDLAPQAVPLADDEEEFLALLFDLLGDNATPTASFSVTMPGGAVAHNADEIAEGCGETTFLWRSNRLNLEPATALEAETDGDESSGCDPVKPLSKVVLIVVLLFFFAFAFVIYYGLKRVEAGREPLSDNQRGAEAAEPGEGSQEADTPDGS